MSKRRTTHPFRQARRLAAKIRDEHPELRRTPKSPKAKDFRSMFVLPRGDRR